MDGWEIVLLIASAYVAVVTLIRLMRRRRDELIADVREQIEAETKRRAVEQKRQKRRQRPYRKAA